MTRLQGVYNQRRPCDDGGDEREAPLAFNWLVSYFTLFKYSSIEGYLDKVVLKSSLQIRNLELKPFRLYRFFSRFYVFRAVLEYYICKRGLSSIISLMLARAF